MRFRLPAFWLFLAVWGLLSGCGSKIDGALRVQPVWLCDPEFGPVSSSIAKYCVSVMKADGSQSGEDCDVRFEALSLQVEETSGLVRLRLEGRDSLDQPVARGISVPFRLVSGEDNTLSVPMALVGRFGLLAGDSGSCTRLPFKSGVNGAVVFPSGHLLVAGSPDVNDDATRGAFLMDPASGRLLTISTPASMRRFQHGTALLGDGRVVVVGGTDQDGNAIGSILVLRGGEVFLQSYNPGLDYGAVHFEESPNGMMAARLKPLVSVFFGDQLLINDGERTAEMWLGSQEMSAFVTISAQDPFPLMADQSAARVVPIDDRRAAVLGGPSNHAGLMEVGESQRSLTFGPFAIGLESRDAPLGLHLEGNWVMYLGGKKDMVSAASPVLLLDVQTGTLYEVPVAQDSFPFAGYTATVLPDGRVLVAGGYNGSGSFVPGSTFIFTRNGQNMWDWRVDPGPQMRMPRLMHTASLLPDGRVVMVGGGSADAASVPHETVLFSAEVIAF